MKISCLIPCYNEEECIQETVEELVAEFSTLPHPWELIIVDHGCTDSSYDRLRELQEKYPAFIKIERLAKNIGYGACINWGLRNYTRADIIGWTCADGEIKADDTRKLVEFIINNPDYAAVKAARINRNSGFRQFISLRYNQLIRILFTLDTDDINGWPLFIRSHIYDDLDIQSDNWILNVEIFHKLRKKGYRFKDMDCEHQRRKGGKSKVSVLTIVAFLQQIMSYRIKNLFNDKNER